MEVEVKGLNEAIGRLEYLREAVPKAAVAAMLVGAARIFAESQVEVPRRTGALASTGRISPVIESSNEWTVHITYGPISYARIVHYNNHIRHVDGRSYFALDPLNAVARDIADDQSDAIKVVAEA